MRNNRKSTSGFSTAEIIIMGLILAFTAFGIASVNHADTIKTNAKKQPEYTITLYAVDGKVIRTWATNNYDYELKNDSVTFSNDFGTTRINGTYVVEPYQPETGGNK